MKSRLIKRIKPFFNDVKNVPIKQERPTLLSNELDEFLAASPDDRGSLYFLGYIPISVINKIFEREGVFRILRKKNYDDFKIVLDTGDPFRHRLALYYGGVQDEAHMLAEVVLKRRSVKIQTGFQSNLEGETFEFLSIEWMCLQNPRGKFTEQRPRLPGQSYPGLGLGAISLKLLLMTCSRLKLAGLLNVPEHFHNSQMYSKRFLYIRPENEGKRRAIARDLLKKYNMAEVSWAIDLNCVLENGKPFEWFVSEQIVPMDPRLKKFFKNKQYWKIVSETEKSYEYHLNEVCWKQKKTKIERYVNDEPASR